MRNKHKVLNEQWLLLFQPKVLTEPLASSLVNLWFLYVVGVRGALEKVVNGPSGNLRSALH
jgi:hypothetical protein